MTARVGIVGAGPVGVVAAIALARKDMRVALFEAEREIDHSPRAATTHPSTLEMLAELGLLEEFQSVGLVARHFQFWDGATKTLVAEFDQSAPASLSPSNRSLHRHGCLVARCRIGETFIENHGDVGPEACLDVDRPFRRQQMRRAVEV